MTTPLAGWIGDLEAAFGDVASSALGLPGVEVTGHGRDVVPTWQGAYLGLVGPAGAVQIGLAADETACQALAKGLMGMSPADAALEPAEMADAVCEIVNIVAGAFKGRVRDRAPSMQMGLPTFFRGGVQPTERTAVSVVQVRAGEVAAALLLVHPRQ